MSTNYNAPQPPPKEAESPAIWPLVIAEFRAYAEHHLKSSLATAICEDMRQRDEAGRAKYGVPLQAGNGRDYLIDAYQEALDLCVYLYQGRQESLTRGQGVPQDGVSFTEALDIVVRLRRQLARRDGR
jgi:hypothetical protein